VPELPPQGGRGYGLAAFGLRWRAIARWPSGSVSREDPVLAGGHGPEEQGIRGCFVIADCQVVSSAGGCVASFAGVSRSWSDVCSAGFGLIASTIFDAICDAK